MRRPIVFAWCGLAVIMCAGAAGPHVHRDAAATQPPSAPTGHDWTQFGWDVARSNWSQDPTGITAANIGSMQRQQVPLEGTVDASAIYLSGASVRGAAHDVFFVTTTYGRTIAIDADAGLVLWTYTPVDYASWAGSYQVTTATPVADPDREFVYAASPDGFVQKLAVADGRAVWRTAVTMLPRREKIAASLNFFNGRVVATTGGYIGDAPPYQGHVAVIDAASGRLERVWNSLCSDRPGLLDPRTCPQSASAIWGRAGAVIDAATGHMFVATGNGAWDGDTSWGDATLEFDGDGRLIGNYTPSNTDELDREDLDVGSTSPVLLGDYVLQGGKDGQLRLLRLDDMRAPGPHRGGEVQAVPTPSGGDLFTAPAVAGAAGRRWIFAADNGATTAWVFRDGALTEAWRNRSPGTSPVVAGGLLYVYNPRGGLHVYEPETGREVATLDCGRGHWNSPIVADGRIALPQGTANAQRADDVLNIWRLLRSTP